MSRSLVLSHLCLPLLAAASPVASIKARAHPAPAHSPAGEPGFASVAVARPAAAVVTPRVRAELPLRRVAVAAPASVNRLLSDARRLR